MADNPDLIALGSMAAMPNFHHHPNFGLAYGGGLVQPMMQHMSFRWGGAAAPPQWRRSLRVQLRPRILRHAPRDRKRQQGKHAGRLRRLRGRGWSSANEADVGDAPPRLRGHANDELPGGLGVPVGYDGSFHPILQVVLTDSWAAERQRDREDVGVARRVGPDGQRHGPAAAAQEVGEVERLQGSGPRWGGGPVRGE